MEKHFERGLLALLVVLMGVSPSPWVAIAIFCVTAVIGLRFYIDRSRLDELAKIREDLDEVRGKVDSINLARTMR